MSSTGNRLKTKLEDDSNYNPTPADLGGLIKYFDGSDFEVAKMVYDRVGITPEDYSGEFAKIASNTKFNGQALGDFIGVEELQRVFNKPFIDEGLFGIVSGTDRGAIARDKLVLLIAQERLRSGDQSIGKILADNVSLVEDVVSGTAEDFIADDPAHTRGSAANHAQDAWRIARALKASLGETEEPDLSETQQQQADQISDATAKQCILLSLMKELDELYDDQISFVPATTSGASQQLPYDGKILKFVCDPPSHFINNLTAVQDTTANYTSRPQSPYSYLKDTVVDLRLSFIRKHPKDTQALLELPIIEVSEFSNDSVQPVVTPATPAADFKPGQDTAQQKNKKTRKANTKNLDPDEVQTGPIKAPNWIPKEMEFDFDINYEGTNPSTARNDVEVTITFKSAKLSSFTRNWKYDILKDIDFNMFDLILFPLYDKDADGYGKAFKSQFSPNYNRVRLTYRGRITDPQDNNPKPKDHGALKEWYDQNSNVLDLTIIDHEFTRDGEDDKYTLKINYRGYVQSLLTTPQTDALGDKDVKERRAERELLIQNALDKGCSQSELSKIITEINAASANDVRDVSEDILKNLNSRGKLSGTKNGLGIYGINASQFTDLADGANLSLEKVKKFIVAQKPLVPSTSTNNGSTIATRAAVNTRKPIDELTESTDTIYFFYLADLLDVILEHADIYDPVSTSGVLATSKPKLRQELKFILGSFNYQSKDSGVVNLNIGHTPISIDFFKEWYKETIVDKELFIYPCLSFIRDIFERIATNLLNEVCFKTTEDQRLLVRTAFFTGTKTKTGGIHQDPVQNFYGQNLDDIVSTNSTKSVVAITPADTPSFPLIKNEFGADINDYYNYCVIYAQGSEGIGSATTSRMVTEFQINNGNVLGEETFSFSRTNQAGLRESRYFRSSTSGITILASVYDTTVKLEVPILTLYPGQFYKITMYSGEQQAMITQGGASFKLFEQLGLDGYYAITKTSHKIYGKIGALRLDNEISGRWVSSATPGQSVRITNLPENSKITDPSYLTKQDDCNILVNLAEEASLLSLNDTNNSSRSQFEIDQALLFPNRVSAGQELTGNAAIGGFGTQAERTALMAAASSALASPINIRGDLTYGNKVITYETIANNDGSVSIIDTAVGSSVGNIIGVFRTDSGGNQIFSENPDYFGGAE
tara:strand:- start:812 stop:4309 length:3498 start_codon:yes stop_codon:yes gene_type:complete